MIQKIIKGFHWVTMGAIVKFSLQMAQVLVLAYFLTNEEMGLFSILMIVVGLAQFFSDLGISTGLVHFQNLTKRQLNTLYWLNVFSGILVAIVLLFGASLIRCFYQYLPVAEQVGFEVISLIQWATLIFLIRPFGQQFQFLFQKEMQFSKLSQIEILVEFTTFIILFCALTNERGLFSVVLGLIGGAVVYAILFFYFGRKIHQPTFSKLNFRECKPVLKFGVYQMGERLLNYLNFNLDKIFVGSVFGLATLGAYELAHQLVWRPFGFLSFINSKLTYPFFSKLQTDCKALNIRFLQNVSLFTFLAYPVCFGMFAVIEDVVLLLFGEGWELTILAFQVLFLMAVWKSSFTQIGAYLLALGKANITFYITVYQIVVNGFVLFLATQFTDFSNFLMVYLIGVVILMTPIGYWLRWQLTKINILEYVKKWLPNLIVALLMLLGIHFFQKLINFEDWHWQFIFSIVIGVGSYFLLSLIFRKKQLEWILKLF